LQCDPATLLLFGGDAPLAVDLLGRHARGIDRLRLGCRDVHREVLAELVVTADDVAQGKPHPEGYLRAVTLLGEGLDPSGVVAFEDTEAGVASAKDAGLRCLAVRGTLPDRRLARADELVDRIDLTLVQSLVG